MNIKEQFKFLAKQRNLLVYGNDDLARFDTELNLFDNVYKLQSNDHNFDFFKSTIINQRIDCLLITEVANNYDIATKIEQLLFETRFKVITSININNPTSINESAINISDSVFTNTISNDGLTQKFVHVLSHFINTDTTISSDGIETKHDRYKDSFDLKILNICAELMIIVHKIDSGDISDSVMEDLYGLIKEINYIFTQYIMLSPSIVSLLNEFEEYMAHFDSANVSIETLEGYEHLSRFVEDISVFLDKYFILNEIDNLYVVEDSLENTFTFIKRVFDGKKNDGNDGSELEFFNDKSVYN